jgi:hypothetical protein
VPFLDKLPRRQVLLRDVRGRTPRSCLGFSSNCSPSIRCLTSISRQTQLLFF